MVDTVDAARSGYLQGRLSFEQALSQATGTDYSRGFMAGLLDELVSAAGPANPPLPAAERQALDEAGLPDDPAAAASTVLRSRTRIQQVTDTALTVAAAAERIGVTQARVRQLISARTLWAFDPGVRGGRRLPAAQFTPTGLVPYLDRLVPHVPQALHPVAFDRLLTAPRPELVLDGQPVSLVGWLAASGGDAHLLDQALAIVEAAGWEAA